MIETCVEAGDFSPLLPLSVKDVIWLRVGQNSLQKLKNQIKQAEYEGWNDISKVLVSVLSDLRSLLLDVDNYARLSAYKGSGVKRIDLFNPDDLPSMAEEKAKREAELRATMSDAEWELYQFNSGKRIEY